MGTLPQLIVPITVQLLDYHLLHNLGESFDSNVIYWGRLVRYVLIVKFLHHLFAWRVDQSKNTVLVIGVRSYVPVFLCHWPIAQRPVLSLPRWGLWVWWFLAIPSGKLPTSNGTEILECIQVAWVCKIVEANLIFRALALLVILHRTVIIRPHGVTGFIRWKFFTWPSQRSVLSRNLPISSLHIFRIITPEFTWLKHR